MVELVKCIICNTKLLPDEMTHVHNLGKVTYECLDSDQCQSIIKAHKAEAKSIRDKELAKIKEKDNKDKLEYIAEKNKILLKEEILMQQYNILLQDLWEYHQNISDGHTHYYDCKKNIVYSWNVTTKKWKKADHKLTNKIASDMLLD
jgi:hypothetical protein